MNLGNIIQVAAMIIGAIVGYVLGSWWVVQIHAGANWIMAMLFVGLLEFQMVFQLIPIMCALLGSGACWLAVIIPLAVCDIASPRSGFKQRREDAQRKLQAELEAARERHGTAEGPGKDS
ncbi:MAG: hypothetical protein N2C14_16375 [Planctomycetales bacterium]